ncbi:DUF4249 domain-containing protein [Lacihabitans sp. CCS-44]|uniref:DUF4249 domain-containing protein n=1 Tax=Lacihabitans sp. CCS-44 TaxID=2487331 RepID=UPI0020CFB732|nr:DUF4249 domain-containing protein [Lacihabitans sp. CCS-44]
MKKNKSKILFILPIAIFIACVEPFELTVSTTESFLIVDGSIDDASNDQFIAIKRFIPSSSGSISYAAEVGAEVSIIKDKKEQINCFSRNDGYYYLPLGFRAMVGSKYQLKIKLADGKSYESSEELMRTTPDITGYTVKFDPKGIKLGENSIPGHLIYIDTKDPAQSGDNFLWSWRAYEKQIVCKTCTGGIFITSPAPLGKCNPIRALAEAGVEYDYKCEGNCWEILYSQDLNVMSDAFSKGNEIKNRLVASIPYYQDNGFLIEIKQQTVSPSAFQYLKILTNQSQNNGTLVDSPPAALIGNIRNTNNIKETVGGYFMVGNSKVQKIWVDRLEAKGSQPYNMLGRNENFEPSGDDSSRPPFAPCVLTNTRTPLKPEGWPL